MAPILRVQTERIQGHLGLCILALFVRKTPLSWAPASRGGFKGAPLVHAPYFYRNRDEPPLFLQRSVWKVFVPPPPIEIPGSVPGFTLDTRGTLAESYAAVAITVCDPIM